MFGRPAWNKGKPMLPHVKEVLSRANKNRIHSLELRKKYSEARKGEKHWNWQGGITSENRKNRSSFEYKLWRKSVFERDGYRCLDCGKKNGEDRVRNIVLNADHIYPFAIFPRLRFDINNGRTLCVECHKVTDTYMGRAKNWTKIHAVA